jgi:hypothetical protein
MKRIHIGLVALAIFLPGFQVVAADKERLEIVLAPEILARYVGRYELAPGIELLVTQQDKSLFVQVTGQESFRVYAAAEKEFFYKVIDGQISFVTDESGRATQLILHQNTPAKRSE